jgi:hypothetical protein
MSGAPPEPSVLALVIGDISIDVAIAPVPREATLPRESQSWRRGRQYREFRREGGAWLLRDIVEVAAREFPGVEVRGYSVECGGRLRADLSPPCPLSIALVKPFPRDERAVERSPDRLRAPRDQVYRLESPGVLGWLQPEGPAPSLRDGTETPDGEAEPQSDTTSAANDARQRGYAEQLDALLRELTAAVGDAAGEGARRPPDLPDLIVVDDHNNGFREIDPATSIEPFTRDNPAFADAGGRGTILWYTDRPLGTSRLWQHLILSYAERLVVVVDGEDLREHGITLIEDLSFEQTACDFMGQLERTPLAELAQSARLVVRFANGVIVYGRRHPTDLAREKLWVSYLPYARPEQHAAAGLMAGFTMLTVGALAKGILWAMRDHGGGPHHGWLDRLDRGLMHGAELGIALGYVHYREGYFSAAELAAGRPPQPYRRLLTDWPRHRQPNGAYARELAVASAELDPQAIRMPGWSRVYHLGASTERIEAEAERVVRHGLDAVVRADDPPPDGAPPWWQLPVRLRCPYYQMGDLQLIDRDEIDSFESIGTIVANYLASPEWTEPLCLAVFGPPGSGKSFSVKQVLKRARTGPESGALEFNLAQFRHVKDLATAFHQVQDRALGARAPLVMFDEFDASYRGEPLGWLKYFLAPMQDGTFRDGDTAYRVGRAIFVFAGGTHATFEAFYDHEKRDNPAFRDAKGPDFVSRLRGHLNIRGINSDDTVGAVLMLRRAILLRHFIARNIPNVIDPQTGEARVDSGVIRAFLRTRRFEHGVRSMEAIVEMAAISISSGSFQKSSLPLASQLSMHVDAREFLGLVNGPSN